LRARELYVLAVYDGAALVGLAPWFVERSTSQGHVIRFLGSGEVCSDYVTVLCEPDWEEPVAAALADWLTNPPTLAWLSGNAMRPWDLIELEAVSAQDQTIGKLLDLLAEQDNLVHRRKGVRCWRLKLPACWDDYLAVLSRSHRKRVRRLDRRLFDTGRAQLRTVTREGELEQGLHLLADLHRRRRESLGDPGRFASERFSAFHSEVARRLLRCGQLRLQWLELDGTPIAAEYHLVGLGVVYAYQSGIDPAALDEEPGALIMLATIKQAIAERQTAFDFLRGDESYKAHWRAEPTATQDIRVVPSNPAARIRHGLWRAGDSVKNWLKSGVLMKSG
jgi:CelD/BcsL family acetyltransferase involved in cellulose biosynthesis